YRGIFWIPDIEDVYSSDLYFPIPCDSNGNINDSDFEISPLMSSKGNDNYNHKNVWNSLSKKYTGGKPYDYYARGRIEIHNGTAFVYLSPHIPQDDLKKWLIDKFNLTSANGIKRIKFNPDYSKHYRCYLDNE
ncbi:MAG: hypothetical protein K2N27_11540, partial [Ruminococcus sp.]|nr:hypothetical protein [Ruminococcus sp.]